MEQLLRGTVPGTAGRTRLSRDWVVAAAVHNDTRSATWPLLFTHCLTEVLYRRAHSCSHLHTARHTSPKIHEDDNVPPKMGSNWTYRHQVHSHSSAYLECSLAVAWPDLTASIMVPYSHSTNSVQLSTPRQPVMRQLLDEKLPNTMKKYHHSLITFIIGLIEIFLNYVSFHRDLMLNKVQITL